MELPGDLGCRGARRQGCAAVCVARGGCALGVERIRRGYLSDRIGRRRVILIGSGVMIAYPLVLLSLSDAKWEGLGALALAGIFGGLGGSVSQAMVADLVAPERRQAAYASVRVAANMGVVIGPPLGGLLLVVGGWTALFPCVAVLSAISWLIAYRYLPRRGAFAPDGPPERGSLSVILADRRFLLFLGSAVFAWLDLRRVRGGAARVARRRVRLRARRVGVPRLGQPPVGGALPGEAHAACDPDPSRSEARARAPGDGASVPAPRPDACAACDRLRDRRVRRRRDAVGADVPGGRRRARAGRTSAAPIWAPSGAHPRSASRSRR